MRQRCGSLAGVELAGVDARFLGDQLRADGAVLADRSPAPIPHPRGCRGGVPWLVRNHDLTSHVRRARVAKLSAYVLRTPIENSRFDASRAAKCAIIGVSRRAILVPIQGPATTLWCLSVQPWGPCSGAGIGLSPRGIHQLDP